MKTVEFQVEDSKLETFLTVLNNLKDGLYKNVIIKNSSDLDSDTLSYIKTDEFQKDKENFQKCLKDFEEGKTIALSHDEVWRKIDNDTKIS